MKVVYYSERHLLAKCRYRFNKGSDRPNVVIGSHWAVASNSPSVINHPILILPADALSRCLFFHSWVMLIKNLVQFGSDVIISEIFYNFAVQRNLRNLPQA